MVPVGWHDILEMVPSRADSPTLTVYGRKVDCPPEKNLVIKAYNALCSFTGGLPAVDFYLEKIIPDGAGLGGGSADAAFTLKGLDELFNLGIPDAQLSEVAATVGADCPFFIYNRPALCRGIGDEISLEVNPGLEGRHILIAKPHVASVSTKEAYAGVSPHPVSIDLAAQTTLPPDKWNFINDFEKSVFKKIPQLAGLKQRILSLGAEYASMTGSGSAIFGIFNTANMAQKAYDSLNGCDKIVTEAL